jgi:hypothetical protein
MPRQPTRPADPPALAVHPAAIEDVGDEFCYELALALRRILGLDTQTDDPEDDDDSPDPHATAERQ